MQKKQRFSTLAPLLFWGYNGVYFLVLLFFGIQVVGFGGFFMGRFMENIPLNVAVMIYILLLTPIACSLLAYKNGKIGGNPIALTKLFFGVELPIIGLAFLRLIFIREMTPVLWLFFISVVASITGLLISIIYPQLKTKLQQTLQLLSQEIAVLLAGYMALLFLFFLPIIAAIIVKGIFSLDYWSIAESFFQTAGLIVLPIISWLLLFCFTIGLFFIAPIAATIIYWNSFKNLKNSMQEKYGEKYLRIVAYGFGFLYILLTFSVSLQIDTSSSIYKLQALHNTTNFEERQKLATDLLNNEHTLRKALIDAYLSPYRYIGDSDINFIRQGYFRELGFDENTAIAFQELFNNLASPFIYHGRFTEDVERAAKDYEEIFDAHIQEGEQTAIIDAMKGTNTRDEMKAGLLDKNKKSVHVAEQTVTATTYEQNLLARVQFEETYQNMSDEAQEVYYEFSLPNDAVLTDLRLGPELEYKGVIAPKGAARTTYENQINGRMIDPALLEQTGPRQYRLRVFPIPVPLSFFERQSRAGMNNTQALEEKPQRVFIEYVTFRTKEGIPLPTFSEIRNAYTDGATQRKYVLNGQNVSVKDTDTFIALNNTITACSKKIFRTPLPETLSGVPGSLYFLPHAANPLFTNYSCADSSFEGNMDTFDMNKINGSTFALLLDTSYSNKLHDWNSYLKNTLHIEKILEHNSVDLYYFNNQLSQKISLTKEDLQKDLNITHFGKTNRLKALADVQNQRDIEIMGRYSAIFMVTDSSDFQEKHEVDPMLNIANTPVYVIHADDKIPQYPDELTNAVIKSGGRVVTNPREALEHFWLMQSLAKLNGTFGDYLFNVNQYGAWILKADSLIAVLPPAGTTDDVALSNSTKIVNTLNDVPQNQSKEFDLLATKKIVEAVMKDQSQMEVVGIDTLQQIHKMALEKFIVTPYSSMIALVNDWQKEQLERAENSNDPFSTTYDMGEEALGMPAGARMLNIGAVPEPHEWALIFIGLMLIVYFYRKPVLEFARQNLRLPRWKK